MVRRIFPDIIKRIVVESDLVLETPAHFSNGDSDGVTDMPLLVDPLEGKPLLTALPSPGRCGLFALRV